MKIRIYVLLLLLCCSACLQDKKEAFETEPDDGPVFDERKWRTKDGFDYPYRNEMLQDLMERQGLRAMKRDQILDLLGEPDKIDTNYLFYRVEQKRIGLFPLHTKTMVIQMAQDNTVNWIKIHE